MPHISDFSLAQQLSVGVDYSITSPAVCVLTDTGPLFTFFSKHIFDKVIMSPIGWIGLSGHLYPDWQSDQDRYEKLAQVLSGPINSGVPVSIEAYAFGASGRVFDLAEAAQTFKHKLYMNQGTLTWKVAPNTLKKHFTGNGHATKADMAQAFHDKTGIWLHEVLGCKVDANPASDLVDAYAAACWGVEQQDNKSKPRDGTREVKLQPVRKKAKRKKKSDAAK